MENSHDYKMEVNSQKQKAFKTNSIGEQQPLPILSFEAQKRKCVVYTI